MPHAALAEPSAADIETARGLYVDGLQLRDAGKLDASLARFKAAHSLAATPITSLELGRAYALVAALAEARDVLASVERMPVLVSESPKAANARVEAHALLEQVKERMPQMRIVFTPEPPSPPHVTVDGTPIVPDALAWARRVNPGSHTILAETADGARAAASIVLTERELRTVTMTLGAPSGPVRNVASPSAPAEPRANAPEASPWLYVGLGTAGLGALTGTITGAFALAKASSLESRCAGSRCPASEAGDLSTSRTMGTVSTIAFAVAGVGAVVALVSWLSGPPAAAPVHAKPNALRWRW